MGYSCPNLSKIAKAYGLKYYKIGKNTSIENFFSQAIRESVPTIVEVLCSQKSIVTPKIMFGDTLDNQSPKIPSKVISQVKKLLK